MLTRDQSDDFIKGVVANWCQSEEGIWCREHVIGGVKLDTYLDPIAYLKVIVYGKLDNIDEMFYKLKWSK